MFDKVSKGEKGVLGKVYITKEEICEKTKELGAKITKDYANIDEPLIVVILLKGSIIFAADLLREIDLDMRPDFMSVSSYGNEKETSREVKILKDLSENINNQNVLIIEDIIDSGNTLKEIMNIFKMRNPRSIKICTLLDKPSGREQDVKVDYVGFEIEDHFILGYGLDLSQKWRNLPHIEIYGG